MLVECDTAFNMLKTTLTSAPVLRHFNLDLRTAVRIDSSQNTVGAVLLQWQPGEMETRPVAFMARGNGNKTHSIHVSKIVRGAVSI